uniref:Golgi associated RAB2 interactor protein-like Rab2B-binding domain-containing protein n=1 Tax=Naja naja TaxID=35670 RepID=A0A8C6X613_NAJNA
QTICCSLKDIHDQALWGWSPSPGKLQKLLQKPEYSVFRGAQTFESSFFQVNKDGQFINIHKHPNVVTIGILASSPRLLLPDLMIIAREKQETTNKNLKPPCKVRVLVLLFLTYRLIPLDLVEISVHDANKRQLKMHLPTGDKHYLQLLAKEEKVDFLFECWVHLIYLMRLASGKSKTPENLPGKKPEVHTLWKSSPLQAKVTEVR